MAQARHLRAARMAALIVTGVCAACDGGVPTQPEAGPPSASGRWGGPGGPGPKEPEFVLVELPPLPGHSGSAAQDVNEAGVVVGTSSPLMGSGYPVLWAGAAAIPLPGGTMGGSANAVGNGATIFVGGSVNPDGICGRPARWAVSLTAGTPSVALEVLGAPSDLGCGGIRGLNDHGDAVGGSTGGAVLWPAGGGWHLLPPPPGTQLDGGVARDINNAGLIVLQFSNSQADAILKDTRAYLRLANGAMVLLAPAPGDAASYAGGVSELGADGTVYVAGTTRTDYYTFRPVRWRVVAATGVILSVDVMKQNGSVGSVSDAGVLGGSVEKRQQDRPALWPASAPKSLPIRNGDQTGTVRGISRDGRRVVGWGRGVSVETRGLLWVKATS